MEPAQTVAGKRNFIYLRLVHDFYTFVDILSIIHKYFDINLESRKL